MSGLGIAGLDALLMGCLVSDLDDLLVGSLASDAVIAIGVRFLLRMGGEKPVVLYWMSRQRVIESVV